MGKNEIKVGIGDYSIAYSPDKILTIGLGSCVGTAIYDIRNHYCGLSHIMLPDSKQFNTVTNPLKFADLAIPIMVNEMIKKGSNIKNLVAKIAGGASMFNFSDKSMIMDIGNRNSISVKKVLKSLDIRLMAEDVGGNKGRTIIFDTISGKLQIKTVGVGIKEI